MDIYQDWHLNTTAENWSEIEAIDHPINNVGFPAGYTVSLDAENDLQLHRAALNQLAQEVLADPLLLELLSDRVYQLMRSQLEQLQVRNGNYRSRF